MTCMDLMKSNTGFSFSITHLPDMLGAIDSYIDPTGKESTSNLTPSDCVQFKKSKIVFFLCPFVCRQNVMHKTGLYQLTENVIIMFSAVLDRF